MENFFQLQHKLQGSKGLRKKNQIFLRKSLQKAQHYEKEINFFFYLFSR